MTKRRVVVTGMGLVTPLSNKVESSWAKLIEGKSEKSIKQSWDTGIVVRA